MKLTADDLAQELDRIVELTRQRMDDGVGHHGEQWRIGGRTAINFMVEKIRHIAGQQGDQCPCNLSTCAAPWEPGCGLGTTAEHARAVPGPQPAKPAGTCSDERPCVPCYSDMGECIGPYRAKPAGVVPMPEPTAMGAHAVKGSGQFYLHDTRFSNTVNVYEEYKVRAYGDAREAAAGGVPAETFREAVSHALRTWPDAVSAILFLACATGPTKPITDEDKAWAVTKLDAIPQQPAAKPAVEACPECGKVGVICKKPTCAMLSRATEPADIDSIALNVVRQLNPYGDPQARAQMQCRIIAAITAEPAVEATGTVDGYSWSGQTVDIILDGAVPRWIFDLNTRVTISPTGGNSDA